MVVVGKTITYVGRPVYTRTGVKVLTDPTVSDSSRPGSDGGFRTAFIGWSAIGSGRVTRHIGSVRKFHPNLLYTGEVVPGKSGLFQHGQNARHMSYESCSQRCPERGLTDA